MDQKIEKTINSMYQAILFDHKTKKHRFLIDIESAESVQKSLEEYEMNKFNISNQNLNNFLKSELNSKKNISSKMCEVNVNKERLLSEEEIMDTYNKIKTSRNEEDMENILNQIINSKLPSTIQSLNVITDKFLDKNENTLNVLIMGGGPSGLFIANYLHLLYNVQPSDLKVNILVLENRIYEEKVRKPFTRDRTFRIGTRYLDIVLPNIYCQKNKKDSILIPIKYLELLLYLQTYHLNIPLYFTKKYDDYEDVQTFIERYKIDVLYDATGGRLGKIDMKINTNFLKNIDMESDKYSFTILKNDNLVKFNTGSPLNKYVNIEYYGRRPFRYDSTYFYITNQNDYELLKDICIKRNNIAKVLKRINDPKLKKKIYGLYLKEIKNNPDIDYIKFNSWEMIMYHRLKAAEFKHIHNQKYLYIGVGDTLFSSHFIIGAGLNRTILFSVKTCHILPFLI